MTPKTKKPNSRELYKQPDELRRRTMQAVKSKNTKLEIKIRRLIHSAGYRYRLHRKDLPGKPDIVFPSRRKVVFVHGCFWHGHNCKRRGIQFPKTNRSYWKPKIEKNMERDKKNRRSLTKKGWKVFVVWECKTKTASAFEKLQVRLFDFLEK